MNFEARIRLPGVPADWVINTMVQRMTEVAPYLENVESIENIEIVPQPDGSIKTTRKWQGAAKAAPAFMRPFISKAALAWIDHAQWYPDQYKVEWFSETKHSKYSQSVGTNRFQPHPDAPNTDTECVISGEFTVFGDKLPAMPAFMGRRLAPRIEKVVVATVVPNFESLCRGIASLYRDEQAKSTP